MMRIFKAKTTISSVCLVLCMLAHSPEARATDCDPFALDPFDSSTCEGGDPDNVPLDKGVPYLVIAGVVIGIYKLTRSKGINEKFKAGLIKIKDTHSKKRLTRLG